MGGWSIFWQNFSLNLDVLGFRESVQLMAILIINCHLALLLTLTCSGFRITSFRCWNLCQLIVKSCQWRGTHKYLYLCLFGCFPSEGGHFFCFPVLKFLLQLAFWGHFRKDSGPMESISTPCLTNLSPVSFPLWYLCGLESTSEMRPQQAILYNSRSI